MPKKISTEFLAQYQKLRGRIKSGLKYIKEQGDKIEKIYNLIEDTREQGDSIHIYAKGRSGSAAVSLALRLQNFGYKVCFIGDVIKEPINSGHVAFLFSGSGETDEVVGVARRAKREHATVVSVTSYEDSSLAKKSDMVFILPGGMEKKKGWAYLESQLTKEPSPLYGGGEFELLSYLFQEALVNAIGIHRGIPQGIVAKTHVKDEVMEE